MANKNGENGKGKSGNGGGGRGSRKRKAGSSNGPNELTGVSMNSKDVVLIALTRSIRSYLRRSNFKTMSCLETLV